MSTVTFLPMLITDDLGLESITFELRFNNLYRLWDKVGTIWADLVARHSELVVSGVQPNQQIFEMTNVQVTLELGLFRVIGRGKECEEKVSIVSSDLFEILDRHLKPPSFTRAGFRIIKSKGFNTTQEAMAFGDWEIDSIDRFRIGENVGFSSSRRYEGETKGLLATLKTEEKQINVNVPWEAAPYLKPYKEKKIYVVADADYYTIGVIDRDAFEVNTWMRQARRQVQRYWEAQ